jgi:predicted RNA-binding protein with PUA domain
MALDKTTLTSSIKNAFLANLNASNADATAQQNAQNQANAMATAIADAIDTYVKSGTVTVTATSGQIVVVGTASTQNNASPIQITGNPGSSTGGIT